MIPNAQRTPHAQRGRVEVVRHGEANGDSSRSLIYKEAESKVWLLDWSKFKRATLSMDAGPAIVTIEKGAIRHVEAANAKGEDIQPATKGPVCRRPAGPAVHSQRARSKMSSVTATQSSSRPLRPAKRQLRRTGLIWISISSGDETTLKKATAVGKSVWNRSPLPSRILPWPDTRILRSEVVAMHMRPGGEEIEKVQAEAPGTIDFMPNRPGQKKRHMEGEGITIQYGPENQIQSFSAVSVTTRTESEPVKGKPQPPAFTSSKGMSAQFEPKTGTWPSSNSGTTSNTRKATGSAKADRAVLDQAKDQITLIGSARFWDLDRIDFGTNNRHGPKDRRCSGRRRRHVNATPGQERQEIRAADRNYAVRRRADPGESRANDHRRTTTSRSATKAML